MVTKFTIMYQLFTRVRHDNFVFNGAYTVSCIAIALANGRLIPSELIWKLLR